MVVLGIGVGRSVVLGIDVVGIDVLVVINVLILPVNI